jgi:hypothetical protein
MLAPPLSPIPAINIEFCVEQTTVKEPSSPFDNVTFTVVENGVDAYRSIHLLPPPVHSPKERATPALPRSKGLDAARFEALRNQSKNSINNLKLGLRKEVAMRAHHTKQIERRNLFLSKIEALPSPTAASLPVTPPESPAVFHFSLPSPGLVSPLALFETLDNEGNARPIRVEQVDFRAKARKEAEALASLTGYTDQSLQMHGLATLTPESEKRQNRGAKQSLPSLDQISKRLGGNITISRAASPTSRLPAFLQRSASPPKPDTTVTAPNPAPTAVAAPVPKYSFTPTNMHGPIARPALSTGQKQTRPPPPTSVTLAGPHIASTRPPTPLTAEALNALAYRAERGTVMMERLQRRFSAPARMTAQQNNQRTLARPVGGF